MAQTAHGVPYPLPDEPVAEGAARIRDVAEALDTKVLSDRLDWGPAGAPDTSLVRAGVGILGTPGALVVADGGPKRVELGVDRLGGLQAAITFGAAADANIHRQAAGVLQTDGSFVATSDLQAYGNAFVDLAGATKGLYFGAAFDTVLYRGGAGVLKTDGHLNVGGLVRANQGQTNQIELSGDGRVYFGIELDTNLYRAGPGSLKTDGELRVGSAIFANVGLPYQTALGGGGNGLASVYFGSNLDTILYRVGVNALKTDGTLDAGAVQIGGSGIGVAGDTSLYRAGAGYWQTDASLILGGKLRYGSWAEAANPAAALVARVPFYDKNETRTGYLHVYDS